MLFFFQPADGRFPPYTNICLLIFTAAVWRHTKDTTVSDSGGTAHAHGTFVLLHVMTTDTVSTEWLRQKSRSDRICSEGNHGEGAAVSIHNSF